MYMYGTGGGYWEQGAVALRTASCLIYSHQFDGHGNSRNTCLTKCV